MQKLWCYICDKCNKIIGEGKAPTKGKHYCASCLEKRKKKRMSNEIPEWLKEEICIECGMDTDRYGLFNESTIRDWEFLFKIIREPKNQAKMPETAKLIEKLKHTWPGEYGNTINNFNKEALKEFGVE